MKFIMQQPFTDVKVNDDYVHCSLQTGDEIEVTEVHQGCPDLACCEVSIIATHEHFNNGQPFEGMAYITILEMNGRKWRDDIEKEFVNSGGIYKQ